MSDELTLGRKLYAFREDRKFSQSRLEVEAELSFGTISRIENGLINPTKETLYKLANALGLNDTEFAYIISNRRSSPSIDEIEKIGDEIMKEIRDVTVPCYVTDNLGKIWFWNHSAASLYEIDVETANKNRGISFIKFLISPQFKVASRIPAKHWPNFFKEQVFIFSKITKTYRKEEITSREIVELCQDQEFRSVWDQLQNISDLKLTYNMKIRYRKELLDIEIVTFPSSVDYRFLIVKYFPRNIQTVKAFKTFVV